jgi:cytochrome c biogenesis protein CcdA/thiol-disulfide isomerase/thioredoxin
MTLLFTSFIAGILTILAPCILPLLPVIVGSSVESGSKKRALIIAVSLAVTVVVFTLLLKASTALIDIPPAFWTYLSGGILLFLGITMLFPSVWYKIPFVGKLSQKSNQIVGAGSMKKSFWGDVMVGAALGPVFSTCSPTYFIILATVLPVSFVLGIVYLTAYAIGLALALFCISLIGQNLINKIADKVSDGSVFKKVIGWIVVVVALLIITGIDKKIETYLVEKGIGVTTIEEKLLEQSTEKKNMNSENRIPEISSTNSNRKILGRWHEIVDPGGFVNTNGKAIKITDYIGRDIIMLDIMTYSCINCIRTFPYLKQWDESYRDKGLSIIGIHTPEFAFEQKVENVEAAMKQYGLTFPIVLDNKYGTWNAYENNYWPRKYIIDLNGNIVYDHIGEGGYDETEKIIRELLEERNAILGKGIALEGSSAADLLRKSAPKTSALFSDISPETYLGSDRSEYEYTDNGELPLHRYRIANWKQSREYIEISGRKASLEYTFKSPSVYIVGESDSKGILNILIDGKPLTAKNAGSDTSNSTVTFSKSKLYQLYSDPSDSGHHTLTLYSDGPQSVRLYAFTFGE